MVLASAVLTLCVRVSICSSSFLCLLPNRSRWFEQVWRLRSRTPLSPFPFDSVGWTNGAWPCPSVRAHTHRAKGCDAAFHTGLMPAGFTGSVSGTTEKTATVLGWEFDDSVTGRRDSVSVCHFSSVHQLSSYTDWLRRA